MQFFYVDSEWSLQYNPVWSFFYHAAPYFAGLLLTLSLVILTFSSVNSRLYRYRLHALLILFTLALGPGLIINGILKDNWNRPRPRQVKEFGGDFNYVKPFIIGKETRGKSFPCGHSSVGFTYIVFWFLFRDKSRKLAYFFLAFSLLLGTLLGIGRMTAGGHFPSDVVFSALIPWTLAFILYYFVFNIPYRDSLQKMSVEFTPNWRLVYLYISLFIIGILLVALATPYKKEFNCTFRGLENTDKKVILRFYLEGIHVKVLQDNGLDGLFSISGKAHGFGFPRSKLKTKREVVSEDDRTIVYYRIYPKGYFTDLETDLVLRINPGRIIGYEIEERGSVVQYLN